MKLIILDLDNTLLHSDKTLSTYTVDTLHRCQEAGIYVAFCTARGETNVIPYVEAVHPDLVITNNGAFAHFHNEIIYSCPLSVSETQTLIQTGFTLVSDTCEITVDTVNTHYWNCKPIPNELPGWGKITYTDYKNFEEEALKVCIETADPVIAKKIAASIPDCNCIPFSDVDWHAFSKTNATKEHAIQEIAQKLHIPLSETIAFGDDHGDIGMLQLAGKGIAMANAISQVKAIADDITVSNDQDGVAQYLERFL